MPHRIIIADNSLSQLEIESLFVFSRKHGLAIGEVPRISDLKMSSNQNFHTKPIVIEDVLGRKQKVQNPIFLKDICNKIILVIILLLMISDSWKLVLVILIKLQKLYHLEKVLLLL